MLSVKPWQPEAVLRLGMWLFSSLFLGMSVLSLVRYFHGSMTPTTEKSLGLVVGASSFHLAALVFVGFFLREHAVRWRTVLGLEHSRLWQSVTLGCLTGMLALPVAMGLGQLSEWLMVSAGEEPVAQQAVQTLQSATSPVLIGFFGLVAILLAPFAEEILFRGIIYPTVKQLGFPRLALWGSSILFALSHANVLTTIPLLVFSLFLTQLYEHTDNLMAPIAAHSLFNAANFAWLLSSKGDL